MLQTRNKFSTVCNREVVITVRDGNGKELNDGNYVEVIKDLNVKGSSITLNHGKVFKGIRLTSKDEEVECCEGKSTIVLKTCFLKKV